MEAAKPHPSLSPLLHNQQTLAGMVRMPLPCRYCCKSPKLPGANFSAVKNPTDDRRSMWPQSRYRGRQRVYLQAMRSPTSLHEIRVYSQKKFSSRVQKDFCNKIGTTRKRSAAQVNSAYRGAADSMRSP